MSPEPIWSLGTNNISPPPRCFETIHDNGIPVFATSSVLRNTGAGEPSGAGGRQAPEVIVAPHVTGSYIQRYCGESLVGPGGFSPPPTSAQNPIGYGPVNEHVGRQYEPAALLETVSDLDASQ